MKKRVFAWLMVLVTLCGGLLSCHREPSAPGDDTSPPTQTEEESGATSNVPKIDFGQRDVRVLHRVGRQLSDSSSYYDELMPSDNVGDIVSSALIQRNAAVEEKFNVRLISVSKEPGDQTLNELITLLTVQEHTFDIISYRSSDLARLAVQGFLVDFSRLPYVDTTDSWWHQQYLENTSIASKNYFAASDMNLGTFNATTVIYFNQTAVDRYLTETYGSLYDIVNDGRWTLELMQEMIADSFVNLDGVDGPGLEDQYGLVVDPGSWYAFFYGSGRLFAPKNNEDRPVLDMASEIPVGLLENVIRIFNDTDTTLFARSGGQLECFQQARAIFFSEFIYAGFNVNAEMEGEYGMIPSPKSSSSQQEYYSCLHPNHSTALAVPYTVPESDHEMVGAIIQDFGFYSQKYVRPAFYEDMLKLRIARNENNYRMFDLIFENIILDPAMLYLTQVDGAIRNLIDTNASSFTAQLRAVQPSYQKILDDLVESIFEKAEA